ncbi:TIGR00730 family Rossman fold protein [Aquibacillus albus]|nr:TIGR00730 family Rossman fold protein [Aquibacillus albus]
MKSICVFAGSSFGKHPEYDLYAKKLGKELGNNGYTLVYGGSNTGLMGSLANSVLESGGEVIGVMPKGLFKGEIVHNKLTKLIEVESMHERKAKMSELADGYIALPGGLGTFEELFEVLCWAQIGIHDKPIGVLNVNGYYDPLLRLVEYSIEEQFSKASNRDLIQSSAEPQALLQMLKSYKPKGGDQKWNLTEK